MPTIRRALKHILFGSTGLLLLELTQTVPGAKNRTFGNNHSKLSWLDAIPVKATKVKSTQINNVFNR